MMHSIETVTLIFGVSLIGGAAILLSLALGWQLGVGICLLALFVANKVTT